ncbi:MAG: hypothetical protein KAT16_01485 [Candidatus Heimdallarchaeota archaeon]|nr:hypothetical protein [Candidatus Heimdallarchaeota archaeon]
MPSILAKWQKCGKSSCRCSEGLLHGPYLWLVTYHSSRSANLRAGKYSWQYLGRSPNIAWEKLRAIDPRFSYEYEFSSLLEKLGRVQQKSDHNSVSPTTSTLLTLPED